MSSPGFFRRYLVAGIRYLLPALLLLLVACNDNGTEGALVRTMSMDNDEWYCVSLESPGGVEQNYPCYATMNQCTTIRARAIRNGGTAKGECERHSYAHCHVASQPVMRYFDRKCHLTVDSCQISIQFYLAQGVEVGDCKRVPPLLTAEASAPSAGSQVSTPDE